MTEQQGATLAIDAGQTGIRVQVAHGHDRSIFEYPGILTDVPLLPQLVQTVRAAATSRDVRIDSVSAGVSGLTAEQTAPDELLAATAEFGVTATYLTHDSVTSYLGALGDDRGVVVAAGTGVVTLAVGRTSVARVDGWGHIMGDAGSGYWLGRLALETVMRAHDGRGPATALTDALHSEFADIEHAYIELQSDAGRVRRIAGYSRLVTGLADTDPVAASLCDAAAEQLAHSAVTALRRVGEAENVAPLVVGGGGVLGASQIATRFGDLIRRQLPGAVLRAPAATTLDGAALLPRLGQHSALRSLVASSVRSASVA